MPSIQQFLNFLLLFLTGVAATMPANSPTVPVTPPARQAVKPIIAAFYYPWYGNPATDSKWIHWDADYRFSPPTDIASDFYPALGPYSSHDKTVLQQHMEWLQQAGVEVIIVSWWGPYSYEDGTVAELMAAAADAGIKVAFHIEPYRGRSVDSIVSDVQYIYAQYGASPAFFRSTQGSGYNEPGKSSGLFFLWNPGFRYNRGPTADAAYWQPGLDQIHALPEGGLVMVQKTDAAWVVDGHFDGAYDYTNLDTAPPEWGRQLPADAWFIPTVIPGFSARRMGYPNATYRQREGGALYERQWRSVLETGSTPPMIAITSFNEWHEGSQIEPAASGMTNGWGYAYPGYEQGADQYLKATARWTAVARSLPALTCARQIEVTLAETNRSDGLYQQEMPDGLTEPATICGLEARKTIANRFSPMRYLYFWVQEAYQHAAPGTVAITVEYLDGESGEFALEYDSTDPNQPFDGAYKSTARIALTGSGGWRAATFELPDAYFGDRQNGGADFRIALPGIDLAVNHVMVAKASAPCLNLYLPSLHRP
ncbi:MAG: hypothetical protein IPK16_29370 [Anaerolineales bacterium]|nr:hypothetical protein [Anaerolineales bacterium]